MVGQQTGLRGSGAGGDGARAGNLASAAAGTGGCCCAPAPPRAALSLCPPPASDLAAAHAGAGGAALIPGPARQVRSPPKCPRRPQGGGCCAGPRRPGCRGSRSVCPCRDDTHKADVINFAQSKATNCLQNQNLIDKESASLLWNFIVLLCRQNGVRFCSLRLGFPRGLGWNPAPHNVWRTAVLSRDSLGETVLVVLWGSGIPGRGVWGEGKFGSASVRSPGVCPSCSRLRPGRGVEGRVLTRGVLFGASPDLDQPPPTPRHRKFCVE